MRKKDVKPWKTYKNNEEVIRNNDNISQWLLDLEKSGMDYEPDVIF